MIRNLREKLFEIHNLPMAGCFFVCTLKISFNWYINQLLFLLKIIYFGQMWVQLFLNFN